MELCVCVWEHPGVLPTTARFRGSGQGWPPESQVQEGGQMSTGCLPGDVHSRSAVRGHTH